MTSLVRFSLHHVVSSLTVSLKLLMYGNRRTVYHSIESGMGYEGLSSFCAMVNMPGGAFTGHILRLKDKKQLRKADSQATAKEKKHRHDYNLSVSMEKKPFVRKKESQMKLVLSKMPPQASFN